MNGNNAAENLDFVFLSATSLQELSTVCSSLSAVLKAQLANHNVPTIIVESTNFVNLEPFVKMSLQMDDQIPVLSIMSDFDIREVGNNNFLVYKSKKESELIYVGKSGRESSYTSQEIGLINKIADLFESSSIDVYKLNTPLEFLSYQWKFALPKITVEPLSIIFEKPFPNDLQNQILAKPLISGLIFEIITVIKTMGCKLFNSYDNEVSLLERLSQLYPQVDLSLDASEAPKLYYDFFNQNQLYLDLLLLQPILIADDYQVKTPYLEFLYAVMSQYNSNNFSTLDNSTSIFWLRKNSENIRQLKLQQDEIALQNSIRERDIKNSEMALNKSAPKNNSNGAMTAPSYQRNPQRSSTDPPIDPEMEELSDMAITYGGISDKNLPNQSRDYNSGTKTPNGFPPNNLQPPFPVNNNNNSIPGNASPNYMPQQNLPHGLPPQGLPPHQPIFNSPQQQPPQMQIPPSRGGRGYYNNGPQPGPGGHPSQMNPYSSRDDLSFMSGRVSHMNNMNQNYDSSFNSMNSMNGMGGMNGMNGMGPMNGMNGMGPMNGMDGMGPMNGMNGMGPMNNGMGGMGPMNGMGGPNRPFKPTSRKSSRKSVAVLTNSVAGNYGHTGGMPSRHSMAPQASNPNLRGAANAKRPNGGISQSNSQFGLDNSFSPPGLAAANGSGSDGLSNGSSSSLPGANGAAAKNSNIDLVPVPEATPAPTPAYVPNPEKKEDKKKKRGFLGFGKKNKE